ncbi:hypothetical protein CDAR_609241 [Caerostris darwini]|uniref:Uncharacterized protein n=1 Tax=Caerostris darwini TaxID=1538125 RepID=A0AAV4PS98_9ARAC|nr:hypothetical protein CDAR_609241 [Caerostris darwini]
MVSNFHCLSERARLSADRSNAEKAAPVVSNLIFFFLASLKQLNLHISRREAGALLMVRDLAPASIGFNDRTGFINAALRTDIIKVSVNVYRFLRDAF